MGDSVIEAQEPDWTQVRSLALALCERTHDLRVVMLLLRAQTRLEGLPGMVEALDLLTALLRDRWETVYPPVDADDNDDPVFRQNALAALGDTDTVLADLRAATLCAIPRLGNFTVRMAEAIIGGRAEGADTLGIDSEERLQVALAEAVRQGARNGAEAALQAVDRLAGQMKERMGSATELEILRARLAPLARLFPGEASDVAVGGAESSPGETAPGAQAGGAAVVAGNAMTRESATQMLQRVIDFLEKTEPANPAPLLIRRAQRLMHMSFAEILRDIAPEGLDSLEKISGESLSGAVEED
jgi:type VI secretion system protein ImpA